ncbi:TPA: hypothetical protein ACGOYV_001310 [Streptococcus suis]
MSLLLGKSIFFAKVVARTQLKHDTKGVTDKVKIGTLAKNACVLDRVIFFTQAVA